MNFNVVKICPDGFLHHHAFDEIRDSLAWSLSYLGHRVNISENWLSEERETNIVFGLELAAEFQHFPPGTIVVNLEQPDHPHVQKIRRIVMQQDLAVWDYSLRSVEEWKKLGHQKVAHLPIGYTPNLTRIPHANKQDIDVAFFGWDTPRRGQLIEELEKHGLKVFHSCACYGGGRDEIISRSKVMLDVHHDGRHRVCAARISFYMANSCAIVTELSSDQDEYEDLRGLAVVPYRLLVDTCLSLCQPSADCERAQMGRQAFDSIRKRDFRNLLSRNLEAPGAPQRFPISRQAGEMASAADAPHQKALLRYHCALREGDMKDFVDFLRSTAKGEILEIGVRDGASTSALLLGLSEKSEGHLYSCDIRDYSNLFDGHPRWTFMHSSSRDLSINSSFDTVLVDGDHTAEGVRFDLELARVAVKSGGRILVHDIQTEPGMTLEDHPGSDFPSQAIREEYFAFILRTGWKHEELPGRFGMGVLYAP